MLPLLRLTPITLRPSPTSNQCSPPPPPSGKGPAFNAVFADASNTPACQNAPSDQPRLSICHFTSPGADMQQFPALRPPSDVGADDIANRDLPSHSAVGRFDLTPAVHPSCSNFPVIGPFDVRYRIQAGAFGVAWAATDRSTGLLLCIKQFRTLEELGPRRCVKMELKMFRRMAKSQRGKRGRQFIMELIRSMQHGNIVFFAMELMRTDLAEYLFHEPEKASLHACQWIAQIALGIDSLHEMGILHRDIKCANILIDSRENVRIIDFGLSYLNSTREPLRRCVEYTNDFLGTVQYMAPEILQNQDLSYDERKFYGSAVDWWALGCILFELESVNHQEPFPTKKDVDAYVEWTDKHERTYSRFIHQGLTPEGLNLIEGLLKVSPSLRFSLTDMEKHAYFLHRDGTSEFDNAVPRALGKTIRPELVPHPGNERPIKFIAAAKMSADYDWSSLKAERLVDG